MRFKKCRRISSLLCFFGLFSTTLSACENVEFAEFDFWVGHWEVKLANGDTAGVNHITKSLTGCVLEEHYKGSTGYEGKSLNIYDKTTQQWHQTWVDNTGLLLQLNGEFKNKQMVMWGKGLDQAGKTVMHRIIWQPLSGQPSLKQTWQISHDQGIKWEVVFEGDYYKIDPSK